jgi:hypothetical protein
MQWTPTFLLPVLVGVVLVQAPGCPTLRMSLVLVAANLAAAAIVLLVTAALIAFPVLFSGALGLIFFACFLRIARGRPRAVPMLALLYLVVVPVVAQSSPSGAVDAAFTLAKSFTLAIFIVWVVYLLWPSAPPVPGAAPIPAAPRPAAAALLAAALLLSMMLLFLALELAHALPALVSTLLILSRLSHTGEKRFARALMAGNLVGGLTAVVVFATLAVNLSLLTLALLTLLVGLAFGAPIAAGGPGRATALVGANTMVILLSAGLQPGQDTFWSWITRLAYIVVAAAFAVGAMSLLRVPWRPRADSR